VLSRRKKEIVFLYTKTHLDSRRNWLAESAGTRKRPTLKKIPRCFSFCNLYSESCSIFEQLMNAAFHRDDSTGTPIVPADPH
jgi:hypothetical protein